MMNDSGNKHLISGSAANQLYQLPPVSGVAALPCTNIDSILGEIMENRARQHNTWHDRTGQGITNHGTAPQDMQSQQKAHQSGSSQRRSQQCALLRVVLR